MATIGSKRAPFSGRQRHAPNELFRCATNFHLTTNKALVYKTPIEKFTISTFAPTPALKKRSVKRDDLRARTSTVRTSKESQMSKSAAS